MIQAPHLLWINHFAVTSEEGGGTRHVELSRELVRRGWRVTLCATDFNYHTRSYTRRNSAEDRRVIPQNVSGVDVRWVWSAPYRSNDWRRARNWISFARELLRAQHSLPRPDVVIGSSPQLFAALAGERLAQRWGVPFILEVRDLWPESLLAAGGRKGPGYVALSAVSRYLYRRARRVIVLAAGTGKHLALFGVGADRIVHVPNGVDASFMVPAERGDRSGMTLVYAGAHGPANGLDVVLDAARLLKDETSIRFILVGDGPAKAALEMRSRELGLTNVEFRDQLPKERMPELLAEADAGLMTLRDSPLFAFGVSPNKLFDYFAAGLPVVCNVPGEVAEMVRNAGAGEQAAGPSAQALADAIRRLAARSPEERRELGRAAREWVVRNHDRPMLAERLDHALRDVIRQ